MNKPKSLKTGEINLESLIEKKRIADLSYYQNSDPIMTDEEYDALKIDIKLLEKSIDSDSGTKESDLVGYSADESRFEKVKHSAPMLSLENAFSQEDLQAWLDRLDKFKDKSGIEKGNTTITCEPKVDGLSLALRIKDKKIYKAITRGDGETGEDVTHNLKFICDLPGKLGNNSLLDSLDYGIEIRGEVYMSFDDFQSLNSKLSKQYATPRNLASGTMRQINTDSANERKLRFFAYDLLIKDEKDIPIEKELFKRSKRLEILRNLGFQTTAYAAVDHIEDMITFYNKVLDRENINYPVDGVVYKIDDIDLCYHIGVTSSHPRWAIAYKLPSTKVTTTLENIDYQVSREGVLTPVGELSPVMLDGVVVKKATLHNFDHVEKLQLKIGSRIVIRRSGDVIPQIIGLDTTGKYPSTEVENISRPETCPSCGGKVIYEAPLLRCPNSYGCDSQKLEKIIHFVSKKGMNIEGLGDKTLELFYKEGIITDMLSIFSIEERHKNNLINISDFEGFGDKSLTNLFNAIARARNVEMDKFLYSLGISYLGKEGCKLLATNFNMHELLEASEEMLQTIDGIGEKTAASVIKYFDQNKHNIRELMEELEIKYRAELASGGLGENIDKKRVVFTGTLSKPRDLFIEEANLLGHKVSSQLSSKTDFLIVGENPGSKVQQAQKLNVKIIDEQEWLSIASSEVKLDNQEEK